MAVTYVQSRSSFASTSAATLALAYSSALTSGSLLLAVVFYESGTQTVSVSDSVNGAWTAVGSPKVGSGGLASWTAQMFVFVGNTSTGTPTVTMTCSGANAFRIFAIHEYLAAGVESSAYVNNNGTTHAAPSLTPSLSSDGAFAFCTPTNSITSVASPYTSRENTNFAACMSADDLSLTAGTAVQATFTANGTGDAINGAAILTAPAVAATVRSRTLMGVGL